MTRVLREVLEQIESVNKATEPYVDDILCDENIYNANDLVNHLAEYGLEAKAPESLEGGKALGLAINRRSDGHL